MKIKEKPSVAIVIPIYRAALSDNEKLSLARCFEILSNYPVIVVKPESLLLGDDFAPYPQLIPKSFPDHFFNGIDAYNRLLTSIDFYKAFDQYEYMLIYQLDAYVFRDELPYWCAKGYGYIGAPSLHHPEYDCIDAKSAAVYANALTNHRVVLNGGLSLRHIAAFIRYLKIYNIFYPAWKGNEDMLFSQEATRLVPMKMFMKTPGWQEALRFAFEKSPAATYELTGHNLPFACHAWERYDPQFWRDFIIENQ